jgi:GNAT superfamily N-acetyltransferase
VDRDRRADQDGHHVLRILDRFGDAHRGAHHIAQDQPADLPAILLGRMGVDSHHQGEGLAAAMLKHLITKALEVSEIVEVRLVLVLVHAKDQQANGFYRHHGFVESSIDAFTLMMLLPSTGRDPRSSSPS